MQMKWTKFFEKEVVVVSVAARRLLGVPFFQLVECAIVAIVAYKTSSRIHCLQRRTTKAELYRSA